MKKQLVLFVCMVFVFVSLSAQNAKKKKENVTFFIEEMDCDHCVKKIEKNISFVKGVTDLKCDLATQTVVVTFKKDKTSKVKLIDAFKKIKMTAKEVKKDMVVKQDSAKVKQQKQEKEHKHE